MQAIFKKFFNSKTNQIKGLQTYYVNTESRIRSADYGYNSQVSSRFTGNAIVFRAVSMIAKSASSVLLEAYKNGKIIQNGSVSNLLKYPNSKTGMSEFIEEIISYQMISGNSYIYGVKNAHNSVNEMQILRPDRVKIVLSDNKPVYNYCINGKSYQICEGENGVCDILHIKNFNPLDDIYGLSGLVVSQKAIDQHNECLEWNRALLKNGARPSGAVVMNSGGGTLSDEQFDRIKMQINEQVSGGDNAGKIMLLEGGLDWREMSMSPKDMDFIETKNSSARDIALTFGVPPQLLGIKGDNTYNNMSEARMAFWEETVIPLLSTLCGKLSVWPSAHFAENIEIKYDQDSISALSGRREILWKNLNATSFLTDDEKRQMLGFNKKPN